jgi:hypothetical protein
MALVRLRFDPSALRCQRPDLCARTRNMACFRLPPFKVDKRGVSKDSDASGQIGAVIRLF